MRIYNHNPKGHDADDCVVRAIAKGENKSWLEVYDSLTKIGREMFRMPNESKVFAKYLQNYPTVYTFYLDETYKKRRYKVKDIAEKFDPFAVYVIRVQGHVTLVKYGTIRDTWDCSEMYVYKIWKVK